MFCCFVQLDRDYIATKCFYLFFNLVNTSSWVNTVVECKVDFDIFTKIGISLHEHFTLSTKLGLLDFNVSASFNVVKNLSVVILLPLFSYGLISYSTTCSERKKKTWCGTRTTFSYPALQCKNILLSALHPYLIFNFYAF